METQVQPQFQALLVFFPSFFAVYLLAYFIVFRNWGPKIRPEASSCMISLAHGTPALLFALRAILADPNRGFASPNTRFQNSVLDFSISYFLMDLLHYIFFFPGDVLFIGHHLATLFVFVTCRYLVSHGAYAILILLILAEVTSACQNVWTLAKARKGDAEFAAKVYGLLSPPFYALYSVVRCFIGPYFVFKMGQFYAHGGAENVIPMWVWVAWIVVVVVAISVSILWITNLWVELHAERAAKLRKKSF